MDVTQSMILNTDRLPEGRGAMLCFRRQWLSYPYTPFPLQGYLTLPRPSCLTRTAFLDSDSSWYSLYFPKARISTGITIVPPAPFFSAVRVRNFVLPAAVLLVSLLTASLN